MMVYQVIGFVILIAFYGCYFIKLFSQKKRGIQTDQLGKGKSGTEKIIECIMKVATVIVPLAEVVSIVLNTTVLPVWARLAGAGIAAAGVAVFIAAVLTMRDSWRAGVSATDKTELVTEGIYKISRNPAFLGFDMVYLGVLLMFFNWCLLVISAFTAVMFHLQIVRVEEPFLIRSFGEEYADYMKRVGRYIKIT